MNTFELTGQYGMFVEWRDKRANRDNTVGHDRKWPDARLTHRRSGERVHGKYGAFACRRRPWARARADRADQRPGDRTTGRRMPKSRYTRDPVSFCDDDDGRDRSTVGATNGDIANTGNRRTYVTTTNAVNPVRVQLLLVTTGERRRKQRRRRRRRIRIVPYQVALLRLPCCSW